MFGTVKLTEKADQRKFAYNDQEIFDGKGMWSYSNNFVRYVVIFGVNNTSSSHIDNLKNNILVSGEGKNGIH